MRPEQFDHIVQDAGAYRRILRRRLEQDGAEHSTQERIMRIAVCNGCSCQKCQPERSNISEQANASQQKRGKEHQQLADKRAPLDVEQQPILFLHSFDAFHLFSSPRYHYRNNPLSKNSVLEWIENAFLGTFS